MRVLVFQVIHFIQFVFQIEQNIKLNFQFPVDLELESVTIGYVFKGQFFLPENASNYLNPLNDPFDLTTRPITGMNRKRRFIERTESPEITEYDGFDTGQNEKFERHKIEAEVIESGTKTSTNSDEIIDDGPWIEQKNLYNHDPKSLKIPQYLGTSRFSLYKGMAAVAGRFDLFKSFPKNIIFQSINKILILLKQIKQPNQQVLYVFYLFVYSKGLSGKACILRSICESAHTPFDYSNGVLGEMMHVIMT